MLYFINDMNKYNYYFEYRIIINTYFISVYDLNNFFLSRILQLLNINVGMK